ncbi:mannose-1-phosphate guanylyltransferase [Erythrobacter sp. NAP1]|uniref:mannose-1-phosphate guanylyltransferase n=1 Tax=Erythrobacter sp. NAP1 TaxID=237727 RepID=UPI00058EEB20|nr:sugar phosphate nucleotidyltransferase [Erythrobacter sp. NAP1]
MQSSIHPVILCGGGGTRLWPVSKQALPKPFLPLIGERTLFQQSIDRVSGRPNFAKPTVVAGEAHHGLIADQASGDIRIVIEPCARNTAAAIAIAAHSLSPDDIMLVCPSDHHISDESTFHSAAMAAARLASQDWLVSLAIEPTGPATGYGYLQTGEALGGGNRIGRFVEKPDLETAKRFLASGNYSWNAGIFAFRAGFLLDELNSHRPEMAALVAESFRKGQKTDTTFRPAPSPFEQIAGESIDYAVMENTSRAAMVAADMGWSDIGDWDSLAKAICEDAGRANEDGNVAKGRADFLDSEGVLTFSDGPRVSVVGLENICVVVDGDEVLVTSRDQAQLVGKLPGASSKGGAKCR